MKHSETSDASKKLNESRPEDELEITDSDRAETFPPIIKETNMKTDPQEG